ncbi:MAG: hypothetical protein COA99_19640 [Moraxellaceae bacterium]|nr:MAG: hypothetical protein COA99_19640 [Moraxellaceae bacterium]
MKPLPIYQPRQIGSVYLLLIPIFGILYWLNPTFWPEPLTFIQSIYFSVITITTLGYGDISPVTETARLISAVEALSGIVLIGLFLNSLAHSRMETEEEQRHETIQLHLNARYTEFRERVAEICLRASSQSDTIDKDLAHHLREMNNFRNYFRDKERWYAVLNGLKSDSMMREDLFVEIDLLIQQVTYALNNVYIKDHEALRFLTRFTQHTYRLRNANEYAHDPVKYLGGFLWAIMAGWCNKKEGYRSEDIIEKSIQRL